MFVRRGLHLGGLLRMARKILAYDLMCVAVAALGLLVGSAPIWLLLPIGLSSQIASEAVALCLTLILALFCPSASSGRHTLKLFPKAKIKVPHKALDRSADRDWRYSIPDRPSRQSALEPRARNFGRSWFNSCRRHRLGFAC